MPKSKIDLIAKLNSIIIEGEHRKNQLFTLKNGKRLKSSLFHYGNGQVNGKTVDGKPFSFVIGSLAKIEALPDTKAESGKNRKTTGKPRGKTVVGQIIDTTEKGSTFENIINVGRAHLPR